MGCLNFHRSFVSCVRHTETGKKRIPEPGFSSSKQDWSYLHWSTALLWNLRCVCISTRTQIHCHTRLLCSRTQRSGHAENLKRDLTARRRVQCVSCVVVCRYSARSIVFGFCACFYFGVPWPVLSVSRVEPKRQIK